MAVRQDVALPAAVTFAIGLVAGFLVAHAVGRGRQVAPEARTAVPGAAAPAASPSGGGQAEQARELLTVHEGLLADNPDDPDLLRTVGNYRSLLGDQEGALEVYGRAEELTRGSEAGEDRVALLVDMGVAHAELGDLPEALRLLEDAAALDATDVRSRLSQVYLYLTRVMPAPPPGFDRREAVHRAERLIDEVLAIDPHQSDALQFKQLIDSARASRPAGTPADRSVDTP